jgi:hypothetical protein
MKRLIALSLGGLLALFMTFSATAQEQKAEKSPKAKTAKAAVDRLSGRIQMINKETSTITIERGTMKRAVLFSSDTKITYLNKPSTMEEVKEGRRVICLGKFNDKAQLVAVRIDVRGN